MTTIKLHNLTRRLLELQGPHAVVCKALGRCLCHRGGGWPVLRLLPNGAQGAAVLVPDAWLEAPDVQAALRRGALKSFGAPDPTAAIPAPAGAPATKAARRRGAKE